MKSKKGKPKKRVSTKSRIHPRSKHREQYDFDKLIEINPELEKYLKPNVHGEKSIDFAHPEGVKALNKALLNYHYGIKIWEIPQNYLCPPIPGRADYIHHIADLLAEFNGGEIPKGSKITCVDIGTGANCIYPMIGYIEYGWKFIGSDIDPVAIKSANNIIGQNIGLKEGIEVRLQENPRDFFYGIIEKENSVDLTICNPPFHASLAEAESANLRKLNNLAYSKDKIKKPTLNFGGQSNELWYNGGERKFVLEMIRESKKFATSCFWFSTLVSKQSNLIAVQKSLEDIGVTLTKTLPMGQGNKSSRVVAWTFLSTEERNEWRAKRWTNETV
jgi:23S rRNA (adenine1618-N6)-methyltransferase